MDGDHADGERSVEKYWDEDHGVDGALHEAQHERPSAIGSILEVNWGDRCGLTFEASFW